MRNALAVAVLMCLLSIPALSQEANWDNLRQLKAGNKIQVVETNLKVVEGKFVRFTEADLTLQVDKQEVVIPKDQVYRVSHKGRGRNALIGLLAGSGAGLAIGAAVMERESGYAGAVAGTAVGFGAIGAGIGAAVPHSTTFYRAEKTKK